MRWTCPGRSAHLSSSQRFRGLARQGRRRTWTQTWTVSTFINSSFSQCPIQDNVQLLDLVFYTFGGAICASLQLAVMQILMLVMLILIAVSEVFMESSPGPSTSATTKTETDPRAPSSTASTPRAGNCATQNAIQRLLERLLEVDRKFVVLMFLVHLNTSWVQGEKSLWKN